MNPKLILGALALFAVLLSACSPSATPTVVSTAPTTQPVTIEVTTEATDESTTEAPATELSGSAWLLTSMNGAGVSSDTPISLTFDDATLKGVVCNSFNGPYTASDDKIKIGQIVSTLKACIEPKGLMDLETAFFDTLGKATTYQRTTDKLTMGTVTNPSALIFKPDVRATS